MVIIDTKTKYVWDYYLKTKDQCFECKQEWLEGEVATMRGRTKGNFEITLFSDLGEAESKKVHKLCNQYGVVKQSKAGYTPEHNAFVERWFRTNAEMSRFRCYSMIHLKLYGRTLGRWQRSSIIGYHQHSRFYENHH